MGVQSLFLLDATIWFCIILCTSYNEKVYGPLVLVILGFPFFNKDFGRVSQDAYIFWKIWEGGLECCDLWIVPSKCLYCSRSHGFNSVMSNCCPSCWFLVCLMMDLTMDYSMIDSGKIFPFWLSTYKSRHDPNYLKLRLFIRLVLAPDYYSNNNIGDISV